MPVDPRQDRRSGPRFKSDTLVAELRLKGQITRRSVQVLDFNRHGLAIRYERPLPEDQVVFLFLRNGDTVLERVIGVVHNCLDLSDAYRCGIRFRTQSGLQFDRERVEAELAALERAFAAGEPASIGQD